MTTAKQSEASRANSQKSTGPRTTAGKANSRFNALKHGIDAKQQVMFTESAEDLAELAAEYHELHSPSDADERFLVDTLVNNEWRLRRLRCVEADLWLAAGKLFLRKHAGEIKEAGSGDAFANSGPAFERLQRIINSCERNYRNARMQLKALQAEQATRDHTLPTPQPEESKASSEPPASFRTNPEPSPAAVVQPVQPPIAEQAGQHTAATCLSFQDDPYQL